MLILVSLMHCVPARSQAAEPAGGFEATTGAFTVKFAPGDRWISISRPGATPDGQALRWIPGGNATNFALLDGTHLRSVSQTKDAAVETITLAGKLDLGDYKIGIAIPADAPGLVRLSLDLTPAKALEPGLFADAGPELLYADNAGQPIDPAARFYFDNPVAHPVKIWHWRSDMNQFVYFGDSQVLRSSLLYYTNFTSLDAYFADSGTSIYKSVSGWEVHDDIVLRPPGALGTQNAQPCRFGLCIPASRQPLAAGRTYRLSDCLLHLVPDAPPIDSTVESSRRFISGYAAIFNHIEKPVLAYHPWGELTERLIAELERRKGKDGAFWEMSTHFNLLPLLAYFERFSPERKPLLLSMASRQFQGQIGPAYRNDFGQQGIFGWYRTREAAAKADYWQGCLWPNWVFNECLLTQDDPETRKMGPIPADVLVETARRLDYTFPVFVNINTAAVSESGYDYDYGAAGLHAAIMLQHYHRTRDARYLDEAEKSARKLTTFGFASGFEIQVPALSALTLLRLHSLTGNREYLDASCVQLAVLLKHTWLFNPHYGRFKDRDLFALTSCRANLCYANGAEEGFIMAFLRDYLKEGEGRVPPQWLGIIAEVLRYKAHSWCDALPTLHADKSVIHLDKPENWDTIAPDSLVPMEPFGYNLDGRKLGFLNECIYGLNLLPEAAMMQFHPLGDGAMLYTEGPVDINGSKDRPWTVRSLGAMQSIKAGLRGTDKSCWKTIAGDRTIQSDATPGEWQWFELAPGKTYRIERIEQR